MNMLKTIPIRKATVLVPKSLALKSSSSQLLHTSERKPLPLAVVSSMISSP